MRWALTQRLSSESRAAIIGPSIVGDAGLAERRVVGDLFVHGGIVANDARR